MAQLNMKKLAAALMNRGGGGAVGGAVNPLIDKVLPATMKPLLKAGLKVGAGALAPELVPKMKIADSIGAGLVGAAVSDYLRENVEMFKSSPSTAGIGEDLDRGYIIDEDRVNALGVEESPISGNDDQPSGIRIEGEEENPLS